MLPIKNIRLELFGPIFIGMIKEEQPCLGSLQSIIKTKRTETHIAEHLKDFLISEVSDANCS